jgi:uncharacterized LabA/DUF88 family protein
VDIALTKEMLSHAFRDNYDLAVVAAGDADYIPLIEEVKRIGKRVHLWFFDAPGLNPRLKQSADAYYDLWTSFERAWSNRPAEAGAATLTVPVKKSK